MMNLTLLTNAHDRSSAHRADVEQSDFCRCFSCLATFPPAEIAEWVQEERGGQTAVCPRCGIDSVIGSASGVDMSDGFFEEMRLYWFG
ncbi:MAG TPA: cytoplasmic protein [Thermoanaerobaculia bacterium]|nr:cytoplasmic protein [Thermoanaerobaculia bacterium]